MQWSGCGTAAMGFRIMIAVLSLCSTCLPGVGRAAQLDAQRIGQIVGVKATATAHGVVRVGWARDDVSVKVDGFAMHPFMGLGTWAAFQPAGDVAMVMGDTVLFEDEVNPAIDAALAAGIEITALHNHFFFDEPRVYFMHIGGHGPPEVLALAVRKVWDAAKEVRRRQHVPAKAFSGGIPRPGKLNTQALVKIVGAKGVADGGLFKITIGRTTEMHMMPLGGSMGITTWAAFAGSDEMAIVDGDFAMTAPEVSAVLKALRKTRINVVALHNHMMNEQPPIYFTHFWGKGKAADLAQGIRGALDAQKRATP
ncbi:MAG: DUF1259 domain-containing protein [Planctomycetaceae bacterium]|nr:DUF1259 domain-containing protein [Planctomycetaceae bacterium]